MKQHFAETLTAEVGHQGHGLAESDLSNSAIIEAEGERFDLNHGDVVIAAITSFKPPATLLEILIISKFHFFL